MIHPPLNKRRTIRNLVLFTVVVISIGFIGRGLDVRMGNSPSESLGMLLWLVVPSVFSLLLRAFGGDGWKDFGIRPNFKGNGKFYLVSLLVYPVLTLIVLLIGSLAGLITFPNLSMNALGMIAQVFLVGALPQFVKNIFEETAWRGYLAPKVYALG
ncbi:MAG: CPBP family intramembrane glutamate endopeptidase, partial [Chloroflexota bacterium]